MQHNILITSAGKRVALTRYFKETLHRFFPDAKVYTTDMNPSMAPAGYVSDGCIKVPRVTDKEYPNLLLKICETNDIGLVIATIDTELLLLADLKKEFAQRGIQIMVSERSFVEMCRDKRNTGAFFENHGVRVPKEVNKYHPIFPLFAKPYDGSLSTNLHYIKNAEVDYLSSAYREIAKHAVEQCKNYTECKDTLIVNAHQSMLRAYHEGKNAFEELNELLGLHVSIKDYLTIYREHQPDISLSKDVVQTLDALHEQGKRIGLITDGRSLQQRNKIAALGLFKWMKEEDIIISEEFGSEKPALENYTYFMKRYPECQDFAYVGDNLKKDFIAPNSLEWDTVCLKDDGRNVHKQEFETTPFESLPKRFITKLSELL